ncbi:hypothetical protein [Pseudomonas gingeri]
MVSISSVTIHNPALPATQGTAAASKDKPATASTQPVEGIQVKISAEGLAASNAAKPTAKSPATAQAQQIEKLRKMMAELQKQIAEKQAQIQAVANSPSSDAEKASKVEALNTEMATLSASLTSATATLFNLMKQKPTPALSTEPIPVTATVKSDDASAEMAPLEG